MLGACSALTLLSTLVASASAYSIQFHNNCGTTVYPAIGAAPGGQPQASPQIATKLGSGSTSAPYDVAESIAGVRAWGRAHCSGSGSSLSCSIGNCNGGLNCNDAGITANTVFAEFGPSNDNTRTAWDLSYAQSTRNMPIQLSASDGQSVKCVPGYCPADQAFNTPDDYGATRNSAQNLLYTVTLCPDGGNPGKF